MMNHNVYLNIIISSLVSYMIDTYRDGLDLIKLKESVSSIPGLDSKDVEKICEKTAELYNVCYSISLKTVSQYE